MSRKDELLALAERCEAARGPDREIDGMIGAIVGTEFHSAKYVHDYANDAHGWGGDVPNWSGTATNLGVPHFTASIDAAMTLVPEGWFMSLGERWGGGWSCVLVHRKDGNIRVEATGATMALAITVAALAAMTVKVENEK